MSDLTEGGLEAMLINIRKHIDETGDRITSIPKYFIARPADLEALGLTLDQVKKLIKEQHMKTPEDEEFERIEREQARGWRKRQIEDEKEKRCPTCNKPIAEEDPEND